MAIGATYVDGLLQKMEELRLVSSSEAATIKESFKNVDGGNFDAFLLDEGLVDKEQLLKILSDYYQVPSFDAVGYFFSSFLLHQFPKGFLLRNAIIPLEVEDDIMIMVASEPDLPDLLAQIGEYVSYDIQFYVGIQGDICNAIKEYYDPSVTQEDQDQDLQTERRLEREEHQLEEESNAYDDQIIDDGLEE